MGRRSMSMHIRMLTHDYGEQYHTTVRTQSQAVLGA
jgi:hypothetical protein